MWELYNLGEDRAQAKDLADQEPGRLGELQQLWFYYAGIYNGLSLDDRTALEQILSDRPKRGPDRPQYTYYPDAADVPEVAGVQIIGRSYTIAAGVLVDSADAEGVLFAHGGVMGGHSLYVKDHRLHYAFNWVGTHLQHVATDHDITTGTMCSRPNSRPRARTAIRTCRASREPSQSARTTRLSAAARS